MSLLITTFVFIFPATSPVLVKAQVPGVQGNRKNISIKQDMYTDYKKNPTNTHVSSSNNNCLHRLHIQIAIHIIIQKILGLSFKTSHSHWVFSPFQHSCTPEHSVKLTMTASSPILPIRHSFIIYLPCSMKE